MRGAAALCLLALLAPLTIHAQTRTERLCWTQQTPPAVTGWRAHYGTASRTYTSQKDMGAPIADASGKRCANVQNLPGGTLYFAATAYGSSPESPLSNEQVRTAQATPPPPPPPPGSTPGPAGQPQFSSAASASATVDVQATWTAAARATEYYYEARSSAGSWPGQNGTLSAASVLLRTVPRGASIWICVQGKNTAGGGSSSCNSYTVPAAQAPPPPPPIAAPAQPSCVHIPTPQVRYTWPVIPNAVKYRVYPAGTSAFLTPESTTPSAVFDLGVAAFAVEVTAVTSDGRESARSPRVTVPAAGPCR